MERRRILVCLGLSLVLHLLIGALWVVREIPPPAPEEFPVRKFVKQLPPSRRTLARRQITEAIQRPLIRRSAARAAPRMAVAPAPLTTQRQGMQGLPVPLMSAPPPPAEIPVQPLTHLPAPRIGPQIQPGAVQGTRMGAEEIDLGVELLDVEALDTGRYRAVVVVDPQDRRGLKGFLYLSSIHSPAIERAELDSPVPRRLSTTRPGGVALRQVAERQSLQGLADKMTEQTQVRVELLDALALDDPLLLQAPFLLLTALPPFAVTDAEAANLGRYLISGGFLYIENAYVPRPLGNGYTSDLPALRELIRQAFRQVGFREGKEWAFARLEMGHPLFHCFYEIDSLPMGFWDWTYTYIGPAAHFSPEYLEGIEVKGRLAGIYSQKDYADFWAGEAEYMRTHATVVNERFTIGGEELPVYDLGINVLVYALTREGSLAQKLVAVE